jgi:very-short-patch-repair endonuclease
MQGQELNAVPIGTYVVQRLIEGLRRGTICPCRLRYEHRGDSVLEEMFWHMIRKTSASTHASIDQFQIGRYRVDSIFDCDGKAVVVELDGKQFHNKELDRIRDAEIAQHVSAIIRVPFAAMWYYKDATMKVLGEWFPRFRITESILLLSQTELEQEHAYVEESGDYLNDDEWYEETEYSYDVWQINGNLGFVGSPKQFLRTSPKHWITYQECGETDPNLITQLYRKSNCRRLT